ncbi:MAG: hypothetical protein AAFR71_02585 [Pseudomonadota bacterium]
MSTKIIKLYDVLIGLDVDRQAAEAALEPILTRDEAFQVLATKEDMHRQTKWIVSTFIAVALGQIGVMSAIMALLLRAYT